MKILLDAVKLVLSKEARTSIVALRDALSRTPEWRKELLSLEARIARSRCEQAQLVQAIIEERLSELNFVHDAIDAFRVAYKELVDNVFEHGCKRPAAEARIAVEVSPIYVSLVVRNASRVHFDVTAIIRACQAQLAVDPAKRRGRGLILARDAADMLGMGSDAREVKAVVYSERVRLLVERVEDVSIILVEVGLTNPSSQRRLLAELKNHNEDHIIVALPAADSHPDVVRTGSQGGEFDLDDSPAPFVTYLPHPRSKFRMRPSSADLLAIQDAVGASDRIRAVGETEEVCGLQATAPKRTVVLWPGVPGRFLPPPALHTHRWDVALMALRREHLLPEIRKLRAYRALGGSDRP